MLMAVVARPSLLLGRERLDQQGEPIRAGVTLSVVCPCVCVCVCVRASLIETTRLSLHPIDCCLIRSALSLPQCAGTTE